MVERNTEEMSLNTQSGGLPELEKAWLVIQKQAPLRSIRSDADLKRMNKLADQLLDVVGDDESHPLYSLVDLVLRLIEEWEDEHVHIPNAEPKEVLRYLLEINNLKQKDLAEIASQTLISEILNGRREISKRLAKALGSRFNVQSSVFI